MPGRPASRDRVASGTTSKPTIGVGRADEPREEQVAERLVVAVQLAVGRDHDERRLVVGQRPAPRRGRIRSRANRSASVVASGSNETDVESPPS